VGDPAPGFVFVADENRLRSFAEACGDVTLVLFSDDPEWPDCEFCRRMAMLADGLSDETVEVKVVNLARPECDPAAALAELRGCGIPSDRLVAITDRAGTIREAWGPGADGRWFVVNRWGRIDATGSVLDLTAAERGLRESVQEEIALFDAQWQD
jgi:hypothetical protein